MPEQTLEPDSRCATVPLRSLTELSLEHLKGAGPKTLASLKQLGITTLAQLLFHLPLRYEDHTKITPMQQVQAGQRLIVEGVITRVNQAPTPRRQLSCTLTDGSGSLTAIFFHAPYLKHQLRVGKTLRCLGQIQQFKGQLRINHPQLLTTQPHSTGLTPIYPLSAGLKQKKLQSLISQALEHLGPESIIRAELPAHWLKTHELPTLFEALKTLHNPPANFQANPELLAKAQRRLSLDSLLAQCLFMTQARHNCQLKQGLQLTLDAPARQKLLTALPFTLTEGQLDCLDKICMALGQKQPMLRLLQGDVGSGKTVLAAAVAFAAAHNGAQAAIMAPTELLATQLFTQIKGWFEPLGIRTELLTGRVTEKARSHQRQALAHGDIDIIIGTHALIQPNVSFKNLAACVIDEQHRFGVEQRLSLHEKGAAPHLLLMSATPIPRSLAMTLFGELCVDELRVRPKGRQAIKTTILPETRRAQLIEQIHQQCLGGEQVFWVCPRIQDSDEDDTSENTGLEETNTLGMSALTLHESLTQQLPDLKVGLIHGKMKEEEKSAVMLGFRAGEYHILVATTVIEVGIDVPRANIIVIETAQRFGLSQLHQLRGRVGRSNKPGFCLLLYSQPLSKQGRTRLSIIRDHHDGFEIAEKDLLLRGPGQWLGTAQSGSPDQLALDAQALPKLMALAAQWAQVLFNDYPNLAQLVKKRWQDKQLRYANS